MRIVMLTESFAPRIGGVEKHLLRVSEELAGRGHWVTILTPRDSPELPPEERSGGVRVLRFPRSGRSRAGNPEVWLWMLRRLALLAESDVVHVHGQTALLAWYLPFRFLLPGKAVFITFHGHPGRFPLGLRHRFERKVSERLCRGNLCVGHYLEKWYGTRASAVTYGATDPPRRNLPPRNGRIVFVGRLEEDTGILLYLRALRIIREMTGEPWSLRVCGAGSLRSRVERFAREHGLRVDLAGVVPDPLPHVQGSRFVFTSGYLSLLDAMICRRFVFSVYENPLKRDYLEMMPRARDLMEISGSPEDLATAFCRVLREPDRETACIERAHRFAAAQTWERMATTYLELYGSFGIG
jgi:glycosyltransferase involved in cell wall biosynthesis